jgi:hypothetical protein
VELGSGGCTWGVIFFELSECSPVSADFHGDSDLDLVDLRGCGKPGGGSVLLLLGGLLIEELISTAEELFACWVVC